MLSTDKRRRKRVADVAEKLSVGLVLGILIQGALTKDISSRVYIVGTFIVVLGIALIVVSIFLSQEG